MQSKVLVVEGRDRENYSVRKYFDETARFTPFYASTLKEAVEILTAHPDIFASILNLVLPDAESGEVVDCVLEYGVPCIILTTDISDEFRDSMLNKPIVDYVIIHNETDVQYAVSTLERLVYYQRKKVLVVDDSSTYRRLLSTFLEELLFDVYVAKDGIEALKILNQSPDIKVVFADYHMPNMDGLELVQEIRKNHQRDDMAIIAITGHDTSVHVSFLKHGADDFLHKPFTKEEFNCRLVRSLRIMEQFEKLQNYIAVVDNYVLTLNTDLHGNITYVSDALAAISGYEKHELIGKNHRLTRHPDMPSSLFKEMWNTISSGKTWHGEIKNRRKDGGAYWISANIHPLQDNAGFMVGYTSTSIDITDRKKIDELNAMLEKKVQEEVVKSTQQQALMIQHSKMAEMGNMIGSIAHQWKQPLNAISMIAQLLPESMEEDQSLDNLQNKCDEIMKQTLFMNQTVTDFRDFFRPDKHKDVYPIQKSIQRVLRIIDYMIVNNNITIDVGENDFQILTVPNELEHVMMNIISNAIDAMVENRVSQPKIQIALEEEAGFVLLKICDNAGGIPEKMIKDIFEPYFSTKGERGTGLGLYISKLILEESLGGGIRVENRNGGAVFVLKLPLAAEG